MEAPDRPTSHGEPMDETELLKLKQAVEVARTAAKAHAGRIRNGCADAAASVHIFTAAVAGLNAAKAAYEFATKGVD